MLTAGLLIVRATQPLADPGEQRGPETRAPIPPTYFILMQFLAKLFLNNMFLNQTEGLALTV